MSPPSSASLSSPPSPPSSARPRRLAAAGPAVRDALVRGMAADGVRLTDRRDEGPDAVVTDGLCSHLAEGGCVEAVISKDASLLLFDTAQHAADFAGCGDDQADRIGRVLVSFGNPARVRRRPPAALPGRGAAVPGEPPGGADRPRPDPAGPDAPRAAYADATRTTARPDRASRPVSPAPSTWRPPGR